MQIVKLRILETGPAPHPDRMARLRVCRHLACAFFSSSSEPAIWNDARVGKLLGSSVEL